MRKDDMTPEVRIDRNLLRICNAAGVSMMHCTEEQLAVIREEMRHLWVMGAPVSFAWMNQK